MNMNESDSPLLVNYHGFVDSVWLEYVKTLTFQEDIYSSNSGRTIVPIALRIIPAGPGKHKREFVGIDKRIRKLFLRYLKCDPIIALVEKLESNSKIQEHRDSNGYGPLAYCVSSTEYFFGLKKDNGEQAVYRIRANQLISYPSKLVHWAWHETNEERYTLTGWKYTGRGLIR